MKAIKLSPSLIDAWRNYVDDKPFGSLEKVRRYITQRFEWSEPMIKGAAFHYLIEHFGKWNDKHITMFRAGGKIQAVRVYHWQTKRSIDFRRPVVEIAGQIASLTREFDKEIWSDYEFQVRDHLVKVRQKIDLLGSNVAGDIKTSKHKAKPLDYFDSVQWRLNCLACPEVRTFIYYFVRINESNSKADLDIYEIPVDQVRDDLEDYVRRYAEPFLDWLQTEPDLYNRRAYVEKEDKNPLKDLPI